MGICLSAPPKSSQHSKVTQIHSNSNNPKASTLTSELSALTTQKPTSLIQKSKIFHSSLEEMKLCVNTLFLIDGSGESPQKKYRIIDKIGTGSFGVVYYAQNTQNEAFVAMKKIIKSKANVIDELSIGNEIEILRRLDHPNILKIFEFYNTVEAYYIVNEFCSKGELFKHVKSKLTETQLAVIFYQIFLGLNYLHSNGVLHRDLKLENIMISETELDPESGCELFWIQLIDFGCAKFFSMDKGKNEKTIVGTSYYMAPEVLQQNYNFKCDIWSAGVLLYMLLTEKAPFNGYNDDVIKSKIKEGKYNAKQPAFIASSPELKQLISQLLEMDVNKRLTAKEALEHPWFKVFKARRLFDIISKVVYNKEMSNLVHFSLQSKLQQMVLAYLCHNISSNEETQNVKKLFLHLNTSCTGRLSKEELLQGITPYLGEMEAKKSIDDLFLSFDGDNSGFIEYEEFLRACLDKETILKEELLQYAFKFFDKHNTDVITRNQLKEMFNSCNRNRHIDDICGNIIKQNDKKKRGAIDYTDFKKMISDTYSQVL